MELSNVETALTKILGTFDYIWIAGLLAFLAVVLLIVNLLKGRKGRTMPKEAAEEKKPRTLEPCTAGLEIANVHGIGKRSYQQDAFAVSPLSDVSLCKRCGVLLVLADGMGGMTDGGKASAVAIDTLMHGFVEEELVSDPSVTLASLLYRAGEIVQTLNNSGSTGVAAIVRGNKLYFAACGDSRLALYRGGAFIVLNREQNYAALLDDRAARGEIPYEEAISDRQRSALTSYLGSAHLKVDRALQPVTLCPNDIVILMSDGIFNALSDAEICACLSHGLYEAAGAMEDSIIRKNLEDQDNFTAILAKFIG
ncbi:MAG TPA: protein phosphatase 2C domain-containing protein [Clostridia bacterium]|nr:protein phosphatase 2C domain-containing protein [Clostridia bacterium]